MLSSSAHNFIQLFLDLFFPPSEEEELVRSLSANDLKRLSGQRRPEKDFIKAVCDYTNPKTRNVVKALKYDGDRVAARLVGQILQEELLAVCVDKRVFADKIVIVPVPLSKKRRRQRGFNQSHRIAKELVKNDNTNTFKIKTALKKVRRTPSQTQLSNEARRENLRDAFRITDPDLVENNVVIILDDVTTTGTTFIETRRALQAANPERILCVAFAH